MKREGTFGLLSAPMWCSNPGQLTQELPLPFASHTTSPTYLLIE